MGVLGEMFPGPKVLDEASEAGDGQKWRLGPIDLEKGVVEVHRSTPDSEAAGACDDDEDRSIPPDSNGARPQPPPVSS